MYIIDILYFTPPLSYASFKYFLFWKAGILKSFPRNVNKIPLSPFMHNVKREYTGYGILFQFLSQNFMNEYSFLKIWICKLQFTISWYNTFFRSVIADSWFFVFTRADEFLDTGHCILFKFLSQNFIRYEFASYSLQFHDIIHCSGLLYLIRVFFFFTHADEFIE